MKPLIVGKEGKITFGALKGTRGKVVGFDSMEDEAMIELDEHTTVVVSSELINQDEWDQLELDV